jgi:hypothetical protein
MLPPLPRRSDCVRIWLNPTVISIFPDSVVGSICASTFSRFARRSLALRPAHSRRHQFVTLFTRRLQPYRYLHDRSGCYWLEPWPGGTLTHRKAPPLHGAHTLQSLKLVARPVTFYSRRYGILKPTGGAHGTTPRQSGTIVISACAGRGTKAFPNLPVICAKGFLAA